MRARRVLVTGAGGKTGRAVVRALTAEGLASRALVRDPIRHGDLAAVDDVEVATGDQRQVDDLVAALVGCEAVYHLAPNVSPDEVAMGEAVLAACRIVGVRRLMFHSVIDPHEPAMPHHVDKGRVEELIRSSDLAWTVLRPNAYLQNLDGYLNELRRGRYRVPYTTDRGLAMVDLREVAEVAAGALSGRLAEAIGATWELSGPEAVAPIDVARVSAELLGHEVVAERQDPDDWATAARDLPDEARRRLQLMFRHYDRHGSPGDPTTLGHLLGREPRGLVTYLSEVLGPDAREAG
jgi:NAD(P)H dehydrogenase (quinone)